MDFFKGNNKDLASAASSFFKGDDDKKETPTTTITANPTTAAPGGELQKKSSAELLSSAKLVAEAAQSALHNESDKLDKAKVAGAAADLLDAAKGYGKLGDEGVGKYVEQAEDYLEKYSHKSTATTTTTAAAAAPPAATGAEDKKPEEAKGEDEKSGSGDYLKMAQGFLGKH